MNNFLHGILRKLFLALSLITLAGSNVMAIGGEDCATAVQINVANSLATCSYSTLNSGTAQNGPNAICSDATGNLPNDDIWVKFVAPLTGNKLVITTQAGTVNDWVMEVWSDCQSNGGVVLKCSDDVNGGMPEISLCQNEFIGGQTYYIRAWTYSQTASGTMNLCVYKTTACIIPPSNDECINATRLNVFQPISCPGSAQTFTTLNATSATSTAATCDAAVTKNDVWFVFNTASFGDINLNITPGTATGLNAQVQFECGGAQVACYNPANGAYTLTGLNPQADYIIRVWAATAGTFNICLSDICSNPVASISGTQAICPGSSANLSVSFNGVPPFTFVYSNGSTGTNVTTTSNPYTLTVTPTITTTYTITSMSDATCSGTVTGSAVVSFTNPQTVTLPAFTPVCSNSGLQTLSGGSPGGGVYSGTGVSSGKFNPASGSQVITYTVTYAAGCTRSATQVFNVNPLPSGTISGNSSVCAGQSTAVVVNLSGVPPYVFTYSNGTTTNQITTSSNPYTVTVTPGSTTTYTLVSMVDNNCAGTVSGSAVVTINSAPNTTLSPFTAVCSNAGLQTLSGGSPSGGVYSGTGVSNNKFDPSSGTQTITYSTNNGSCGSSASQIFTVKAAPTATLGSLGSICNTAAAFTLSGGTPAGGTYSGTGVSANSFNPGVSGVGTFTITYSVTSNGCTSTASNTITVTACNSCPNPATATAGADKISCNGAAVTLSGSIGGSATSGTWSGGAGSFTPNNSSLTASYTPTAAEKTAGLVKLVLTTNDPDGAGACTVARDSMSITFGNLPSTPAITGSSSACKNTSNVLYSITIQSGATYAWTVPTGATIASGNGTNSILVNFSGTAVSGNICVTLTNTCGSSNACKAVTITALPVAQAITGISSICRGQSSVYKTTRVASATSYIWTPPLGATINGSSAAFSTTDTSVTVVFGNTFSGDTLRLKAVNCSGNGAEKKLRISRRTTTLPTPGLISGLTTIPCGTTTATYKITAIAGSTGYTWRINLAGALINGQASPFTTTDTSVVVTFPGFSSTSLFVKVNNSCGSSSERSLVIAGVAVTAAPGTITGLTSACRNQTTVYKIAKVPGATSYSWTPPLGATINGSTAVFNTVDTAVTVVFGSTFSGDSLRVRAINCGGASAYKKLKITRRTTVPSTPSGLTGPTVVCGPSAVIYKINNAAGAVTYTWRSSVAGTTFNGQAFPYTTTDTIVSVSVPTFATGNLFVKSTNACGSSPEKALAIKSTPAAVASVTGPTSVCKGQSNVVYSTPALPGATSYTWTMPAAGVTLVSGQGTTSITVNFSTTAATRSIKVAGTNSCGSGTAKAISVVVAACPRLAMRQ